MYLNVGKDLKNKIVDTIHFLTGDSTTVLSITFFISDIRVIFRNNDTRKSYKINITYDLLFDDINKIKNKVNIYPHFDKKYNEIQENRRKSSNKLFSSY